MNDDDFYEDDEPVEDVLAAFERGEKGLTARRDDLDEADMTEEEFDAAWANGVPVEVVAPASFRCEHFSISMSGAASWVAVPTFGCGCKPVPVWSDMVTSVA